MSENGEVQADPLFLGLTRPPMFLGVSYMFVLLNGFAGIITFIQSANFKVIPILVAVHMVGYVICFNEPLFLELFIIRSSKCNRCRNKTYHGANSYDVY